MSVDGLHSTRPIEFPVAAPREADAMFDVLTYEKGASVLRMLEQYLGPEVFRAGVRQYLTRAPLRQRRHRRPVGRPRPGLRPADPGGHGRLDLRARLSAGERQRRAAASSCCASSASPICREPLRWWGARRGRRRRPRAGRCPCSCAISAGGRDTVERVLLSEPEVRRPAAGRLRERRVNEGGHGFYRVRYDADLLRRGCWSRLPKLARDRALQPGQRRVGGDPRRPHAADRLSRPHRAVPRRARQERVDDPHRLARHAEPAGHPGRPAAAWRRWCATASAPALAALGWDAAARRGRADPPAARRPHPRARHARQRSAACRRRRPSSTAPTSTANRRSTPTCCRR